MDNFDHKFRDILSQLMSPLAEHMPTDKMFKFLQKLLGPDIFAKVVGWNPFVPAQDVFCGNGHKLVCVFGPNGGCDKCGTMVQNTEVMECKQCDYWLCRICAEKKQEPEPKKKENQQQMNYESDEDW